MVAACAVPAGSDGDGSTSAPGSAGVASESTPAALQTGDLDDPEVRRVVVGDRSLVVAWADSSDERQRGLMEVDDLGDLDGMMFEFQSQRNVAFTMRNTLIPLDIYFFDSDGAGVGRLEMVPCEREPCPTYSIDEPVRYALEVPAGTLDLGDSPHLELP